MTANMRWPYHYAVYGLVLHSSHALPLPAAAAAQHAVRVTITFVRTDCQLPRHAASRLYALPYCNTAGESLLQIWQLPAGAGYWVRSSIGEEWAEFQLAADGSRVDAMVRAATPLADLAPPLCGLVLPLLLRLHGVTCLHASAVTVAGRVVAFTGPAETGKSTTLAALLRRGCAFFSDDLVPLHRAAGRIMAYGGFPQVGLWPNSMRTLLGEEADLPYLWQESPARPDKRILVPNHGSEHSGAAVPVGAVYLLPQRGGTASAKVRIESVSPRDAVAQLVPHTTGRALASAADLGADLTHLAHLARTAPVRLVVRPDDLTQLDAVAEAIRDDIASLVAAAGSP